MSKRLDFDKIFNDFKLQTSADFFISKLGSRCCTLEVEGRQLTLDMDSDEWQQIVMRTLRRFDPPVRLKKYNFEDLQSYFFGEAYDNPARKEVRIRSGRIGNTVYIDMIGPNGEMGTEITPGQVKLVDKMPIPFLRPMKQEPFPFPNRVERRQFLKLFKSWQNLANEDDYLLVLAWIVTVLMGGHAYPIFVLTGGQGSGKTFYSKRLRKLSDPTSTPVQIPVTDTRDFVAVAHNSFLIVFDNMSGMTAQMADNMCTASTGGNVIIRELHKTVNERCVNIHRPILINGIDDPTQRRDFQQRCIFIETRSLGQSSWKSEAQLEREFEDIHASLVGGIFDLLSEVLNRLPDIQTTGLHRMTEFVRIGIALEQILELQSGTFKKIFNENIQRQILKNISIDEKIQVLIEKLRSAKLQTGKAEIEGSYSDLCKMLNSKGPRRGPPLFKDSRDLAQWRKRNFELLDAFNVTFEELPYRNQDFRLYKFSLVEDCENDVCEDNEIPDL